MFLLTNIGLGRFESWFQEQSLIGVNIILMGFLVWMLYKRAYIPALLGFIAISCISAFIAAPETSREVAAFIFGMIGIG